ncbi:hypothetical protein B0O80DRAFT_440532 [Mortierella sp. GBAus27b]|nr:hypothetical protein B0O80DRAFT_440532 [Mortierella sp. GBAus27b]
MLLFAGDDKTSAVYTLDVTTLAWKKGASIPSSVGSACAVSGDQFISWGGGVNDDTIFNKTLVYNLKTDTWTTSYFATSPPSPSSTTTAPQTSTQQDTSITTTPAAVEKTPKTGNSTVNIVVATGFVIIILITAVAIYYGSKKRRNVETGSTGSNESVADQFDIEKEPTEGSIHHLETASTRVSMDQRFEVSSTTGSIAGSLAGSQAGSQAGSRAGSRDGSRAD